MCEGDIDIRNQVEKEVVGRNCSVIEGSVSIVLMDHAKPHDFDNYQFTDLVEITGYLLLYRVSGLRTLRYLFPNLRVIRGNSLFFDYALVVYEMQDLQEIGLSKLVAIQKGSVRLEKNNNLCYYETINWSYITSQMMEDHYILKNKKSIECVDVCPAKNCPTMESTYQGQKISRQICWDNQTCQASKYNALCKAKRWWLLT